MDLEFDDLFAPAPDGGAAIAMMRRLFGGIIDTVRGVEVEAADTWINTAVAFFNVAGLLAMIFVGLYTVLVVALDTAKDGSTFGQQTSTTYTLLRVVGGAIAFIPVTGGFSVGQVFLLWLLVQASSMADAVWDRLAANELEGETFVAASKFEDGLEDQLVRQEMARGFNALVTGHICRRSLNIIDGMLAEGSGSPAVSSNGASGPAEAVIPSGTGDFTISDYGDAQNATVSVFFRDTDNAARGTRSMCGVVQHTAPWTYDGFDDADFFPQVMTNAARARLTNHYLPAITELSAEADALAGQILLGAVTEDEMRETALRAVDAARLTYVTGAVEDAVSDEDVAQLTEDLLETVRQDGWVMAAAWQRGISRAVVEQRGALGDFTLDIVDENNVGRFLSGRDAGVVRYTPLTREYLTQMELAIEAYQPVAPMIVAVNRGAPEDAPTSLLSDGGAELRGWFGWAMQHLVDMFAVRDDEIYSDPMVDITEFGNGLALVGGSIMGAGAAMDIASVFKGPLGGSVLSMTAEHIFYPVGYALLFAGFIASSLIPLMPIVYFLSAVLSWFLLIIEGMFALPLAVLSLFAPAREGTLLGSWNRILLIIFGIFLRPLFTVIGLFLAMLIIAIALDFSNNLFSAMIVMVGVNGSLANVLTMLGVVIMSVIVSFYIVMRGSALITEIGDGAMNWLNVGISRIAGGFDMGRDAAGASGMGRALTPSLASRPGLFSPRGTLTSGPARPSLGGGGGGGRRPAAARAGGGSSGPMPGIERPGATRAHLAYGNVGRAHQAAASWRSGTHLEGTSGSLLQDAAMKKLTQRRQRPTRFGRRPKPSSPKTT